MARPISYSFCPVAQRSRVADPFRTASPTAIKVSSTNRVMPGRGHMAMHPVLDGKLYIGQWRLDGFDGFQMNGQAMKQTLPKTTVRVIEGESGWKGPIRGDNLETTVRGFQNGFVCDAEPRRVRLKVNEGGAPAIVEDDDIAPDLNAVLTFGSCGWGGHQTDSARTKLRAGFSEIVVAVDFGDACIDEDKAVDVGQGHERKEFRVFEPVEAVNVIVHYTKVIG